MTGFKTTLTVLMTASLLGAAGCGGDDGDQGDGGGLSKQDLIARADAICKDANAKEAALDPPAAGNRDDPKFEDPAFQARFVAVGNDAVRRLKTLKPAEEEQESFGRVVSTLEQMFNAATQRVAALRAGDQSRAARLNDDFENGQTDVAAAAGGYGLAECQGLGF
jgi:hypothetical protein